MYLSLKISLNKRISRKNLLTLQDKLIRNQIGYVYNHSKFYRTKFKASNLKPSMIKGYKDLHKIPILTKKEVIDNYQDIIIQKESPYETKTTSGSTGQVFSFIRTQSESLLRKLLRRRSLYAMGISPVDRILYIHNLPIKERKLFLIFKSYQIRYEAAPKAFDFIEKHKINCIFSAPSTLEILGENYFRNKKRKKLKIIISFGELLTENKRKKLEYLFDAPVFNFYAMKELPIIGAECKKREGLHINSDVITLETIRNNQQTYGKPGKIVITDLFNKCAPLIRYDTGDMGILKKDLCSCGCSLPLLSEIIGKHADFIIRCDGQKVSFQEIISFMSSIKAIKRYKVTQETLKGIIIRIVASDLYSKNDEQEINKEFKRIFPNTNISIKYVKNIPQYGDVGKVKYVESKLKK